MQITYTPSQSNLPSTPVSVLLGGTGDTGSAWQLYTPKITMATPGSDVVSFIRGSYKTIGTICMFSISLMMGTMTGSGYAKVTLPFTAVREFAVHAVCVNAAGTVGLIGCLTQPQSNILYCFQYNNIRPVISNYGIIASGIMEIAP